MPTLPTLPAPVPSQVIVVEAAPGRGRREQLQRWLDDARAAGATGWLLPCAMDGGGVWAGLNRWMEALLPALEAEAPDLVVRHDSELLAVLPSLRRRMSARYVTLTESAPPDEAVRNYAQDRAYRFGQGIINLLDEWHTRTGGAEWVVACDSFDERGAL
ncbi:MAG TPA: hypothetical protein VE913_09535, partial [Longimicrobium sp.]|nr:hypothetical protein [Longimicrobium sp.]